MEAIKPAKETTMNPATRTLTRVVIPEGEDQDVANLVETLMGKKAELRFRYIQEHAEIAGDIDV